jgi:sugar phosphate isomerase/epimerase
MVLDTAHLYMSSGKDFQQNLEYFLNNHANQIPLIHVCDSTMKNDGLAFGKGSMDMKKTIKTIKENFDGKITLEVMPEHQGEALEKWSSKF